MRSKTGCWNLEGLEVRALLSAAADITNLTKLRADPTYSQINGRGIGVAVIDTGTWAQHPDLRGNFKVYFDAVKNNASKAGDTRVTAAVDPDGHGSHVAGIAVSSNPDIGVATGAGLIAIRGLASGNEPEPSFDPVANALQWVLNNYKTFNIKVVNMSIGVPTVNDNTGTLRDQESAVIQSLEGVGVTVVSAAGNNYADFAPKPGAETPGSYSTLVTSNTWADNGTPTEFPIISGSDGNVRYFAQENDAAPDRFAATSQRSTLPGQIAAPGTDILSTWNSSSKLYQQESGTSMASPFIAGTVALMQQAAFQFGGRYLTPAQIRSIIINSADTIVDSNVSTNARVPVTFDSAGNPVRSGRSQDLPETGLTFKRVNVYAAVSATRAFVQTGVAKPDTDPTQPSTPTADSDNTLATSTVTPALDGNATFNFNGSVGSDGQVKVGAADVDLYKVTLASPGVLSAQLTAGTTTFSATLRLFDSNGTFLTSQSGTSGGYPTLVSGRLAVGTYYIGISATGNSSYTPGSGGSAVSGSGQGDYALTLGLANPDPNGVPTGSTLSDLLSPNAVDPINGRTSLHFPGSIGSDPNPLNPGGTRVQIGATDVDIFKVVASDSGRLLINTQGFFSSVHATDGVITFLRVLDSNFKEIARTDPTRSTDASLSVKVTFGKTYYVAVSSAGNTDYAITNPFDRTNPANDSGSYEIYMSLDNGDVNGTLPTATAAKVGTTVIGSIGNVGGKSLLLGTANGGKDVNFYSFTAASTGLIDLTATAAKSGFSPVIALWQLSSDGSNVNRVADTSGRSAHIITNVTRGQTFYVSVTGQGNDDFKWFVTGSGSGGQTGNFMLTSRIRPAGDLAALTNSSIKFGQPSRVVPGTPVYANLGQTGAVTVGASAVNLYRYVATYTGPLTARATVPGDQSTDPFLRVFTADGTEVTSNDDVASNTRDAQATFTVNKGQTYYIGVNPSSADARNYNPVTGTGAAAGTQGDYVLLLTAPARATLSAAVAAPSGDTFAASPALFTLSLSAPATAPVTATFTAKGITAIAGTDFSATTVNLTVLPGQTSATATVPLSLTGPPGAVKLIGGSLTGVSGAIIADVDASTVLAVTVPGTAQKVTGSDLAVISLSAKVPASTMPGDGISGVVTVRSAGTSVAKTRFSLQLVASADGNLSPDDLLIAQVKDASVNLPKGKTQAFNLDGKLPAKLSPGKYRLFAQLVPVSGDSSSLDNAATTKAISVQYRFGSVPGRGASTSTSITLPGGLSVSLTGGGSGTATFDADSGLPSLALTGTTSKSVLTLTTAKKAVLDVLQITSTGVLGSLIGPTVNVIGDLTTSGTIAAVRLRNR